VRLIFGRECVRALDRANGSDECFTKTVGGTLLCISLRVSLFVVRNEFNKMKDIRGTDIHRTIPFSNSKVS